jgi:hypothetical protein
MPATKKTKVNRRTGTVPNRTFQSISRVRFEPS